MQKEMEKFDLHVHSIFSFDSLNSIQKLCMRYASLGFQGFALTDHGTAKGWEIAKSFIKEKNLGIEFIPGCEFLTSKGEIIGIYLSEMIYSTDPMEVIDQIHSQGGIAILPHPFDFLRRSACNPYSLGSGLKKLDAIEAFNARAAKWANQKAYEFVQQSKLSFALVGGSDAHFLFEAGAAYTLVPSGMPLLKAISKKKACPAGSCSPFFVHGTTTIVKFGKKLGIFGKIKNR